MAFDPVAEAAKQDARRRYLPASQEAYALRARRRKARIERIGRKITRALAAVVAGIVALIAFGTLVSPIGAMGLVAGIFVILAIAMLLLIYPKARSVDVREVASAPPAALPAKTEAWLAAKRRDLPRLAAPKVDAIAARLAILEPQLASVSPADPVAGDLSRLLGSHLPELVERYTRVPPDLRSKTIDESGASLEKKLVDGLDLVESELARVSEHLSQGDRDAFLIQGRFLESRYGKDGIAGQ